MSFDKAFFAELRLLTESNVSSTAPPGFRLRPTVPQLRNEGKISHALLLSCAEFLKQLNIRSKQEYKCRAAN